MEGLNLYAKKVKRVSVKTLVMFLVVMFLPAVGGRIFLEMQWKHNFGDIKVRHLEIIEELKINMHGNKEDLMRLDGLISKFNRSYQILSKQRKDIIEFLKEAYSSKRVLSTVMNSLSKDETSWMILTDFEYSGGKLHLVMYEIYSDRRMSDEIARRLGEIGSVKKRILFDVNMSGGKKMSKVVIDYEAR